MTQVIPPLNLEEEFIPIGRPNRPRRSLVPTKITIHNTSNPKAGADARAHSRFVRTKGYWEADGKKQWISWHYTVDDRIAIQQLPNDEQAYHAGDRANAASLAIEICMQEGIDQDVADARAALLTASLLHSFSLPIGAVVPHKEWTGKNCPILRLEDWNGFVALVERCLASFGHAGLEERANQLSVRVEEGIDAMCWREDDET